ncbi:MAG TPA: YncE family protein [Candidatus Fraserbacteria bacterium]|nr:YncE family protein [Candidatus Fraserbacteria bacterium]
MNRLWLVLLVIVAIVVGTLLWRGGNPQETPTLALVDYTSQGGPDGVAIVDLNPGSRTFGEILQRVAIAPGANPHHLYYNRDGSRLYTTALGDHALYRITLRDERIEEIVPLDTGSCVGGEDLYFSEDGKKFYLTCLGSSQVIVFDAKSERMLSSIEAPPPNEPYFLHPHGIDADEGIDRLIITNTISLKLDNPQSALTIIELSSGKVLSTHLLAKDPSVPSGPVEVTFLPARSLAFVTNMLEGTLWMAIWNEQSKEFKFKLVDDGGPRGQSWPLEIYPGPDGNLYVSWAQPGLVNVYNLKDPEAPRLIRTLPAEPGAHHIAFSDDGRYLFVQNNLLNLEKMNAGTISVLDLNSGRPVATVDSFIQQGLQPASLLLLGRGGGRGY